MFLFRRGQTLSCPLPWWRHSWYRPVVIVYSWPPPTPPHPTHLLLEMDTNIKPTHPSLDDDTLKIQPFKHRYSNKLSHVQYVIQWGFDHFTESARLKTHEQHYLYTEDTNSQRLAQDGSSCVVGVKCKMKRAFSWRRKTNHWNNK